MKFVLAIFALALAISIIVGGIMWATGNIDKVINPAEEAFQGTTKTIEGYIHQGKNRFKNPGNFAANTASISPEEAAKRLGNLKVRKGYDPSLPQYDREHWGGWSDLNQDCRNTRAEILERESSKRIYFSNGCIVATGEWQDPWSGQTFQDASEVDVDHHVPLANAHYSGGHAWSMDIRQQYYNDTRLPVALNAMNSSDNRAKGARGPERWQPAQRNRHCAYATGWVAVKSKYGLSITEAERNALADMLGTCPKTN